MIEKFEGVILGSAIGDALGKAVEDVTEEEVLEFYGGRIEDFVTPHPSSPAYGQLPHETSDETTIMKILLESVVTRKGIDVKDFLERLIRWYKDEPSHRYPDPSLLTVLDLLQRGIDPSLYGFSSRSVEGILRSVVVGLLHYYNPELAAEGAKLVSMLTHRSPEIQSASAMLGAGISFLILEKFNLSDLGERIRFLEALERFSSEEKFKKPIEAVKRLLLEGSDLETAIFNLGNGSYVFESFPLALFIFLSYLDDPREALFRGVNAYGSFGGDTDSIGFLVGSFVGAYFGRGALPAHLIAQLEDAEIYTNLARKLYELTEKMTSFK